MRKSIKEILNCEEIKEKFELIIDCCISCHEDFDMGYDYYCTIFIDDKEYLVCCAVHNQYLKKVQQ
jgi:hypothetical protein